MKRAIKINAEKGCTEIVRWSSLEHLQKHCGGLVERVETPALPDCSVLVDEEGLFKDYHYGFLLKGYPNILCGNGLVVGNNGIEFMGTQVDEKDVEDVISFIKIEDTLPGEPKNVRV